VWLACCVSGRVRFARCPWPGQLLPWLVAALRCLYRQAEDDGLITAGDNPARKVDKPRRLPPTRRAVTDDRLAEICRAAAEGGDDPELDTLLLRLHTETACRRGGGAGTAAV
jgi:integrase/recombinase XerC